MGRSHARHPAPPVRSSATTDVGGCTRAAALVDPEGPAQRRQPRRREPAPAQGRLVGRLPAGQGVERRRAPGRQGPPHPARGAEAGHRREREARRGPDDPGALLRECDRQGDRARPRRARRHGVDRGRRLPARLHRGPAPPLRGLAPARRAEAGQGPGESAPGDRRHRHRAGPRRRARPGGAAARRERAHAARDRAPAGRPDLAVQQGRGAGLRRRPVRHGDRHAAAERAALVGRHGQAERQRALRPARHDGRAQRGRRRALEHDRQGRQGEAREEAPAGAPPSPATS